MVGEGEDGRWCEGEEMLGGGKGRGWQVVGRGGDVRWWEGVGMAGGRGEGEGIWSSLYNGPILVSFLGA